MKRTIAIWSFILIPTTILAIYIGETLSAETAALAMGAILGIMFAALGALIVALVREDRARRAAEEARRRQPAREIYTDAAWREWQPKAPRPSPQAPAPSPQLEAPTRAITTRNR